MEGEIINYVKVWLQVIPSLCYCFLTGKLLPPRGCLRLLAILPIVCLFLYLPLTLHTVHLGGTLAFFIAWLANFKLLLFAFGKGPLSEPSLSLKQFVALASFPIKILENPPLQLKLKSQNGPTTAPSPSSLTNGQNREKSPNGTTPSQSSITNGHTRSHNNGQHRENHYEMHKKSQNGTTQSPGSLTNGRSRSHNNGQNGEFPDEKSQDPPIKTREKSQNGTTPSRDSLTNGHSKSLNSNSPARSHENGQNKENPDEKSHKEGQKSLLNYAIKGVILAGVVRSYEYSDNFHPKLLLTLYSLHIYLMLEIILVMVAAMARTILGIELEPQFNEPYLSSSLQDFWGRRWNMVVSKILRPTVYKPAYNVALRLMGRKWASLPAVFATFLVSGFMHELMFYYLGRVRPTWEITWFFLLHGFCLVIEIGLKKKLTGKFRLTRVISGPLTVGFVMVTGFWLFFPQLLRCQGDERALQEYAAVGAFVKNVSRTLTFNASGIQYP